MNAQIPEHVVELRDAGVVYGDPEDPGHQDQPPAVSGVDLALRRGECVLLAGGSGSGKSTVIRRINALVPHFHTASVLGHARTVGLDPATSSLEQVGSRAATVMQNPRTQFFTGDVDAELAFAGENAGLDPALIRERMNRATELCGIQGLRGRDLNGLSGGQLQKVACAVALAQDPDLLLLDEPSSNLSPDAIGDLAQILKRLKREGLAMVIAEHRLHYLRDIIDTAVLFRGDLEKGGQMARSISARKLWQLSDHERGDLGLRDFCDVPMPAPEPALCSAEASGVAGVEIRNLRFSIKKKQILNIAHMHFPAGAITALTGSNGAGKTTLARTICGLYQQDSGQVLIGGVDVASKKRRGMCSLVMQDVSRQLFGESAESELTVGMSAAQKQELDTGELLARMDLSCMAKRHPLSLSGGQQQRLVIAAALATNRTVHVLDEPTSGLDLSRMHLIAHRMRELAQRGDTVIVVTHDAELVRSCADHVIRLKSLGT